MNHAPKTSVLKTLLRRLSEVFFVKSDLAKKIERMPLEEIAALSHLRDENGVLSAFNYRDDMLREAIWEIKYRRNRVILKKFCTIAAENLVSRLEDAFQFENFTNPVLVPVPCSKKRLRDKGWNHAEDIAMGIRESLPVDCAVESRALVKIAETQKQTSLKKKDRLQNLRGAFLADRKILRGRNVILVDDVKTTGSTLAEARRALKKAGARKIISFVLAA